MIADAAHPASFSTAAVAVDRACPACAGRSVRRLAAYSTAEWQVVACEACHFVYLGNPPEYGELETDFAWEKTYVAEAARRKKERPFVTWLDQATRWRLHMLRPGRQEMYRRLFAPGRVLDVGCADGNGVPEPFVPHGIEISRALHAVAEVRMAARGGRAVHGPAAEAIAEFPENHFSGVILSSVLEHEVKPKTLLARVARVLAPGGVAYVRVPNFGSLNRMVGGGRWCGVRHPDHVNYFTVASLRRMAVECGLSLRLLNPFRLPVDDNINAVLRRVSGHPA